MNKSVLNQSGDIVIICYYILYLLDLHLWNSKVTPAMYVYILQYSKIFLQNSWFNFYPVMENMGIPEYLDNSI